MSEKERENEKKDVEGLISDLEIKIEELRSAPEAMDPVSESIKHLLGQGGESAFGPSLAGGSGSNGAASSAPVNDLTGMVKKKKRVQPQQPQNQTSATGQAQVDAPLPEVKGKEVDSGDKRKAEEAVESDAKKAKTE